VEEVGKNGAGRRVGSMIGSRCGHERKMGGKRQMQVWMKTVIEITGVENALVG